MPKIIFFGSDHYSATVLDRLLSHAGFPVTLVVTTPPRPQGRQREKVANEVENLAIMQQINVSYYPDISDNLPIFIDQLHSTPDHLGLTASFGRLIAPAVIDAFGHLGIINIHPSLLPQYRNVAPVPYAIALGDQVTGVTIFRIGHGIDNGEILAQQESSILPSDTSPILLNRLFLLGADLFLSYLNHQDSRILRNQDTKNLIFTRKLTRDSGYLEWPVFLKLIADEPTLPDSTANPLVSLRLRHHPGRQSGILRDLVRALSGWEKVWTMAATSRGQLQLAIDPASFTQPEFSVLIAGKPKPVSWTHFQQVYL